MIESADLPFVDVTLTPFALNQAIKAARAFRMVPQEMV